jgi:hypothetical protein
MPPRHQAQGVPHLWQARASGVRIPDAPPVSNSAALRSCGLRHVCCRMDSNLDSNPQYPLCSGPPVKGSNGSPCDDADWVGSYASEAAKLRSGWEVEQEPRLVQREANCGSLDADSLKLNLRSQGRRSDERCIPELQMALWRLKIELRFQVKTLSRGPTVRALAQHGPPFTPAFEHDSHDEPGLGWSSMRQSPLTRYSEGLIHTTARV